ncbi:MAG: nucleoside/nucleotide kinase family protein, partial [Planctomycetota bacterium]
AASAGLPVILTIDVDGGLQIKRSWPEVTLVFVRPPSEEELKRRLLERRRDETIDIEQRLRRAEEEYAYADEYDSSIVNDQLEAAVEDVGRVMSRRCRFENEDS